MVVVENMHTMHTNLPPERIWWQILDVTAPEASPSVGKYLFFILKKLPFLQTIWRTTKSYKEYTKIKLNNISTEPYVLVNISC